VNNGKKLKATHKDNEGIMVESWFRHALFDNYIYWQKHVSYDIKDYGMLYLIDEEWLASIF